MQRSRRLLFVLSPDFLLEKSFSLLECRLGLYLQHGAQAAIVTVVYRSVSKLPCVEVAQLRQAASTSVTWRGTRSEAPRSRFWLRLRLALPVRPLALGRRLIDSTSSHSDLAAMALQRVQRIQNQEANQSRRSRRASANQSVRGRQAPPRGRGQVKRWSTYREEASQHSRRCSGCTGFTVQAGDRGAEPVAETGGQQESHDRTETRSEPAPPPDPTQDPDPTPNHDPDPEPEPDSDSQQETKHKQQQVIGSGTPEEL